nr:MAG: replication associated protein [Cressdnaviricota sp.]
MLLDEDVVEDSERQEPPTKRAVPAAPPAPAAAPGPDEDDPSEEVTNKRTMYARWCFTWYPGDSAYRPAALPTGAAYMVYQEENCPETGKLHLQGYLRFAKRVRWSAVLKELRKNMIEPSSLRLTHAVKPELACKRYCTKLKTRAAPPVEMGEPEVHAGEQGHRTDLEDVVAALNNGQDYASLALTHPTQIIKYGKGIKDLIETRVQAEWQYKMRPDITVTVLYGPTNTGKSHRVWFAENTETEHRLFQVEPSRGPFDKYKQQPAILFDEFGMGENFPLNLMKRVLDKYPYQTDCRFNGSWAAWTRVYIISNDPPATWWMMAPSADKVAFWRRVTSLQEVTKREDDPEFEPELHCRVVPKPVF